MLTLHNVDDEQAFKLLDWVRNINYKESLPSLLRLNFGCTLKEGERIVKEWGKKNPCTCFVCNG